VWQNGGDLVDDVTNPKHSTMSTPAVEGALQFLADLTLKEKVAPPLSTDDQMGRLDPFRHAHVGMIYMQRSDTAAINKGAEIRWVTAALPKGKLAANIGVGSGFCITKGSRHQEDAWKLVKYLAGPDGQRQLLNAGFSTPALEVMANSDYVEGSVTGGPSPFVLGLKIAHPLPFTPRYAEIAAIYQQELEPLWFGQETVQQACQKIDQRVNQVLAETKPVTAWLLPLAPRG
jgi:multiple sugar transport system substrate-binding protein